MNSRKIMTDSLLLLLITAVVASLNISVKPVSAQETGPAADTLIFKSFPVDLAAQAVAAGDMDYYIFGLRSAQAEPLKNNPDVTLYYAPVRLVDVGLNPAPAPTGQLNPFSLKKVRWALNYLMDRDYIVTQTYKGFAAPMVTFLSAYDPDFVTIYDIVAKYDFKYDPTIAAALVNDAMTEAGAVKVEGKWQYNNNPVAVNFVIRIEDERREVGDTFASALENMGFTVNRRYMSFGQAIPIIYGTDPVDFEWHLYTEGWGKGALSKYDDIAYVQYTASWYGYMPGWQETGYWQYANATIDELTERIYTGNFTDKEERDSLYRTVAEMAIQESIRIWAITALEIHPARSEVSGLTEDLGIGLRSPLTVREAVVAGRTPSTITVGHLWVHTDGSAWNPIAGHDDVYSIDQWRVVHDPFLWRHPFSGLPIPFRWSYTVDTAGPNGNLTVPQDAVLWNANANRWEAVGTGVTAKSKVIFDVSKYIGAKWHNNQNITWADVLFPIYQHWEVAFDTQKKAIEGNTAALQRVYLAPFKGFKIVDDTVEVYIDFWHFDENYIADYADVIGSDPPSGHYPWEVLAAMDVVVFEDQDAMYSEAASTSFNVPWLSVNLPAHAALVNNALDRVAVNFTNYQSIFNVTGTMYATSSNLNDRVVADHVWYGDKNHMVISDGPFYMNRFDAAAQFAEYKAFRDPSYPFSKGNWLYGRPTPPEITKTGIPTVVPGGAASFVIEVSGLPPLGVKYLIRNPITAEIVKIGDAEALTSSRFVITLPSNFTETLEPGLYELTVAAYSREVALVSAAKVFFDVFNVLPLESAFQEVGTAISQQITQSNNNLTQAINNVSTAINNLMMVMVVVAVLVVVDIVVTLMKRPK